MNDDPDYASNQSIRKQSDGDVMKFFSYVSICMAAVVAHPAFASDAHQANAQSTVVAQAATMADAEVRKVDKEARKITLKHGPIENLGMPGMTMVFQVKDAGMLDKVKAGDKVRFAAEKVKDAYTVTRIEAAK